MQRFAFMSVFIAMSILLSVFQCGENPPNPADSRNTAFIVVFKTEDGLIHEHSVVEYPGKKIGIGASLNLPENFDSMKLVIQDGNRSVDTFFTVYGNNDGGYRDTIWKEFTFATTGVKTATFTPYTSLGIKPVTANITILPPENAPVNHPPQVTVTGKTTIGPLEPCSLKIAVNDTDSGQTVKVKVSGNPAGSQMVNDSLFVWNTSTTAPAHYSLLFTATDNGVPPLTGTATVELIVTNASSGNTPPQWSVTELPEVMTDTASYSLSLTALCTDADTDALTFILLPGAPAGDTVVNGNYSITATSATIGTHDVRIVASDSSGASDTLLLKLTIESSGMDTMPPIITLVTPITEAAIITALTFTIDLLCSDASGIESVVAMVNGKTYDCGLTNEHYTTTITGLKQGTNNVVIKALDASAKKNEAVKQLILTLPATYTISYDGSGSTSGKVPADTGKYVSGATMTVAGNTGTLEKTGSTFTGWNALPNGTGKEYKPGDTLIVDTMNMILYAQWQEIKYTVTYFGNGNTGGTVPPASNYLLGMKVAVAAFGNLEKTGYTLYSWNTDSAGNGIDYTPGTSLAIGIKNIDLYARWIINKYEVVYDGNGNTAGVPPSKMRYDFGTLQILPGKGDLVRTGYTFIGWNTKSDGSGKLYLLNDKLRIGTEDVLLFAQWQSPGGMVLIPAKDSTFQMGSLNGSESEQPVHTVKFTHNFWMDTTEVTRLQYDSVMGLFYKNFNTYEINDNYPANLMNWFDAVLYCNVRTKSFGSKDTVYEYTELVGDAGQGCRLGGLRIYLNRTGFRLPTEAEWEYACRAGTTSDYYWGNDTSKVSDYAWYNLNSDGKLHTVAQKLKNKFNLYDMCGNVIEWCNDWYGNYQDQMQIDPAGPSEGTKRVARNGCRLDIVFNLRSSSRYYGDPGSGVMGIGTTVYGFRTCLPIR